MLLQSGPEVKGVLQIETAQVISRLDVQQGLVEEIVRALRGDDELVQARSRAVKDGPILLLLRVPDSLLGGGLAQDHPLAAALIPTG